MGKNTELPGFESVSTKQQRIAQLAWQMPQAVLTKLSHHVDMDWLYEAYRQKRARTERAEWTV